MKRVLIILGALVVLCSMPALAGATVAFNKLVAPYTFANQPTTAQPIWVANNDGSGARQLPISGQPFVSPDGKMIAYAATTPNAPYEWNVASGPLHFYTIATGVDFDTQTGCVSPVWAPNSSAVACWSYGSNGNGLGELFTLSTAGTSTTIYTNTAKSYSAGGSTWSPSSEHIAWTMTYNQGENGKWSPGSKLRAIQADGKGQLEKLSKGSSPVWGPSGVPRIAFIRGNNVWELNSEVWSDSWQVSHWTASNSEVNMGPFPAFFTPNGKKIVGRQIVALDDYGVTVVINGKGNNNVNKLTGLTALNNFPAAVSADGKMVLVGFGTAPYATTIDQSYYRTIPIAGGKSQLFMSNVTFLTVSADWQP